MLRFFSDLECTESHAEASATENEASGPLRKNVAFQWAQTISHICGKEKLQQALPHFRENNSEELRDLLEFSNNHEKEHNQVLRNLKGEAGAGALMKPIHRRTRSESAGGIIKERIRQRLSLSSARTQHNNMLISPKDGVLTALRDTAEELLDC